MTQINTNKVGKVVGYQGAEVRPKRRGWLIWLMVYGGLAVGVSIVYWLFADFHVYIHTAIEPPMRKFKMPFYAQLIESLVVGNVVSGLVLLPIWVGKVIWWKLSGRKVGPGL